MGRALALLVAAAFALPATAAAEGLTIYSSLPLVGRSLPQSADVLRGERLALEQAGGRAGALSIRLVSLNDATRASGAWEPGRIAANARRAARDPSTIAYPPAAQAFYAAFRARFGKAPEPYAIYGYEAMSVVLDAIARGGGDRQAVVDAFFTTENRDSVLGLYSIDENGDTTRSTYGVLSVSPRGRLRYDRTIDSAR